MSFQKTTIDQNNLKKKVIKCQPEELVSQQTAERWARHGVRGQEAGLQHVL